MDTYNAYALPEHIRTMDNRKNLGPLALVPITTTPPPKRILKITRISGARIELDLDHYYCDLSDGMVIITRRNAGFGRYMFPCSDIHEAWTEEWDDATNQYIRFRV